MYNLWLKVSPSLAESGGPSSVGARLYANRRRRKIAVAIVGLDAPVAEKTRLALYDYNWTFGDLTVVDAGNLRKTTPEFLTPLLRELHASGVIPVLIGADRTLFRAQYEAFAEINRQVSILSVDQRVRSEITPAPSRSTAGPKKNKRGSYHLSYLGLQEHLVMETDWDRLRKGHAEYIRLGRAQADLPELEPLIRDADLAGFDAAAIQFSEAPARDGFDPSGFSLRDASQLAYYAGNSDKLASLGLYGFRTQDKTGAEIRLTASAYAQLIWYFLKGVATRNGDFPATTEGMLEYVVGANDTERLTFWRSPRSNRWWMQIPAGRYHGEDRHRLVPCSYADYQSASQGEVPDRLVRALVRFG